ncbi:MAG: TonB-dependent receptor, partial [Gemmatimonadota bacterium]|nr:TonB-dependent receptor [Gemmatimonadota bacterium]
MTRPRALAHPFIVFVAIVAAGSARAQGARTDTTQRRDTTRRDTLESVVIRATRAPAASPAARAVISREQLQRTNAGQDAPMLLESAPSITAYSDAGGFSGYSYVRFRGLDQTRLNITVDGVPLNDPEDQVLYFSNVPDLLGSMSSVEVGRGVGASTFGTAPFAGSLNFESMPLATTLRGGQADVTAGSFDTWRTSVQGATGIGSNGLAAYGRFTRQGTDGYRRHSGNDSWSGFGSVGWFGTRDAVKLTVMSGLSGTRLAYYAAPEKDLAADRRANPVTDAEGDRFHQEMVSVQYSRAIADGLDGTLLAYRNSAAGAYDVYFGDDPAGKPTYGNFGLAHVWHGLTAAFTWTRAGWTAALGGTASDYHRDHWLAMRPDLSATLYANRGVKRDAAAFAKGTWRHGAWSVGGDVNVRYVHFLYEPSANAGIHAQPVTWSFVNPKAGVRWDRGGALAWYANAGRSWREPARSDLLAGADDINAQNVNDLLPFSRVHPEKVDDYETGVVWRHGPSAWTLNVFDMEFHNEIAPIGQIALTGAPLRKNVPSSYRRGVELDGALHFAGGDALEANATVMRGEISEYHDETAGRTYHDIAPLLTPPLTANVRWTHEAGRLASGTLRTSVAGRHVAAMHLA